MSLGLPTLTPTASIVTLLPTERRDSLIAWLSLYMVLVAAASSENTFRDKNHVLKAFLDFFRHASASDHPYKWTLSVTAAYLKQLGLGNARKPTTLNRILATLRHSAAWITGSGPDWPATPANGSADLILDDPAWKALSDLELIWLRSAVEQLLRQKQIPLRDHALFPVVQSQQA